MAAQASAQSSGDVLNAIKAQQAEIDGLKAKMDALVASQLSLGAKQYYESKPAAVLREEANAATAVTQQAIDQVKKIPEEILNPALRQSVISCAEGAAKAAKDQLSAGPGTSITALLEGCSESKARAILKELEQARQAEVAQWQQCGRVINSVANGSVLPANPAGIPASEFETVKATLKAIGQKNGLANNAVDCVKTMDKALDSIKAQDTAAGALSAALTTASQVCAATGGNPYVCGGMLVVAILMNLFNSGKGDGNGDGKGDGKGPENKPGPYTGNDIATNGPPDPAPQPPGSGPVTPTNVIGVVDPSGKLTCTVTNGVMTCVPKANPATKLIIDPAKSIASGGSFETQFKQVLNSLAGDSIFVCLAGDQNNFINGILITMTDGTLAPIKLDYSSGVTVRYPPKTIPGTGDKGGKCPEAFRY